MAEIISFRKAKKVIKRQAEDQQASENRIRFGRTKAEKENDRRSVARREALLDGAERETPDTE